MVVAQVDFSVLYVSKLVSKLGMHFFMWFFSSTNGLWNRLEHQKLRSIPDFWKDPPIKSFLNPGLEMQISLYVHKGDTYKNTGSEDALIFFSVYHWDRKRLPIL